jgi:hypothetical protein
MREIESLAGATVTTGCVGMAMLGRPLSTFFSLCDQKPVGLEASFLGGIVISSEECELEKFDYILVECEGMVKEGAHKGGKRERNGRCSYIEASRVEDDGARALMLSKFLPFTLNQQ